jgi:hypothetical protein
VRTSESLVVPAAPGTVYPHVDRLEAYPAWLGLVHDVAVVGAEPPAWSVELRARVGPVARSKRLRMVRTTHDLDRLVEFEREEVDGRDHARWALRVELEPIDAGTLLTMHLAYDGALWTGGLLERVLDAEIRRGRSGLVDLVRRAPTQ